MLVNDLSGNALDYWVARALGNSAGTTKAMGAAMPGWSSEWRLGGPLIEQHRICLDLKGESPAAFMGQDIRIEDFEGNGVEVQTGKAYAPGATALEAAMRCLVASVFGTGVPAE